MSIDTLEQELLSYRHPITTVSDKDIEGLGYKKYNWSTDDKYPIIGYKLGNKTLSMIRVNIGDVNAISWLLQVDGKNKQLVHTLVELERITNGE